MGGGVLKIGQINIILYGRHNMDIICVPLTLSIMTLQFSATFFVVEFVHLWDIQKTSLTKEFIGMEMPVYRI